MPNELRLKKLPLALAENGGKMGAAMLAVGFAKGYALSPDKIKKTKAFQRIMKPYLEELEDARAAALKRMGETVNGADYAAATNGLDKIQKQIQLVTGNATELTKIVFVPSDVLDRHAIENGIDASTEADSAGQTQIQGSELRS